VLEKAYDMNFKGIGLDFVDDQKRNEEIIAKIGFPKEKALFAGIVNGHNIWTNDYQKSVSLVERLSKSANNIVLSTSSSLLHSPYTLQPEVKIPDQFKKHLSFADEKIQELDDIKQILNNNDTDEVLPRNRQIIEEKKQSQSLEIAEKINNLSEEDFTREIPFSEREKIQSEKFGLPVLPTTTIGSFPQTQEVRKLRRLFKK
jgi:5-methyltetrahydropteroyltriglutamate--homocysteine methyltransferase